MLTFTTVEWDTLLAAHIGNLTTLKFVTPLSHSTMVKSSKQQGKFKRLFQVQKKEWRAIYEYVDALTIPQPQVGPKFKVITYLIAYLLHDFLCLDALTFVGVCNLSLLLNKFYQRFVFSSPYFNIQCAMPKYAIGLCPM